MHVEAATARTLPDPEPGYVGPERGAPDGEGNQLGQPWLLRAQEMHSSSPLRRSKPSSSDGKSLPQPEHLPPWRSYWAGMCRITHS